MPTGGGILAELQQLYVAYEDVADEIDTEAHVLGKIDPDARLGDTSARENPSRAGPLPELSVPME